MQKSESINDLPHAVGEYFDNVHHLAQLLAITMDRNVSKNELQFRCGKSAVILATNKLDIALSYWKDYCLHFQLSFESF